MVRKYVKQAETCITIKDVQGEVLSRTGRTVGRNDLSKYMKNVLNLRYKFTAPRPIKLDSRHQLVMKHLFCIEMANILNHQTLILNIDESTINYKSKFTRSWIPKGA